MTIAKSRNSFETTDSQLTKIFLKAYQEPLIKVLKLEGTKEF